MTSSIILTLITIIVIITTIVVVVSMQEKPQTFGNIITVGPVWNSDVWACTSNQDFLVSGALRGIGGGQIAINIPTLGTQSLYTLEDGKMESFTIGAQGGQTISITRTGLVTGFLTLQTLSGADANCAQNP